MSNKAVKNIRIEQDKKKKRSNQIHMLMTISTIAITCVFCAIILIENSGVKILRDEREVVNSDKSSWVKSYSDEESVQVAIEFDYINTQLETYELLREKCNEYIENESKSEDNIKVTTDVNIEEFYVEVDKSTVVDSTLMSEIDIIVKDLGIESNTEDSKLSTVINNTGDVSMHETGPLYFQDRLLLRYINSDGDMQVIMSSTSPNVILDDAGKIVKTEMNIKTFSRDKLQEGFNTDTFTKSTDTIKTIISNNILTEEQYIQDIAELFIYILKIDGDNINQKFKRQALKYFTLDGYNNIIDSRNRILLDESTQVDVTILEAGKSNTDISTKDRIFMQLKSEKEGKEIITNIIVKLDNNFKIFDIDIL